MKNGAAFGARTEVPAPYRQRRGRSTPAAGLVLAVGTIECRAPALDDAPYGPAARASLAFTVVHGKTLGEVAKFAVRTGEIAKRGAASGDGLMEDRLDCGYQAFQALERNRSSRALGMNTGTVQGFANVDVAQSRHDPLVEQKQLDRRQAPGKTPFEIPRIQAERLWPERVQHGPFLELISAHQIKRSEPAGIVKRHAAAILRRDDEMVVFRGLGRIDSPMP